MEPDKFIVALGTPEEWSRNTPETVSVEVTPDVNSTVAVDVTPDVTSKKIIGSVATKEEVDLALDSLKQD